MRPGRFASGFGSVALVAGMSAGGIAAAQDTPPFGTVSVRSVWYGGSGCPQGAVASNLAPDAKALTLLFSEFQTSTEAGDASKKSCRIGLQLNVPAGWSYTVFSVDYRGFADVDDDSSVRLRSWYALDASPSIRISNVTLRGPRSGDFQQRAYVPLDSLPWLACTGTPATVIIDSEIKAEGDQAMLAVDSIDGEIQQRYGVAWRRCSTASQWQGDCQVVLESQWGANHSIYQGRGTGPDHGAAKSRAEADARAQCERVRGTMRPLMQALMKCQTNAVQCGARP